MADADGLMDTSDSDSEVGADSVEQEEEEECDIHVNPDDEERRDAAEEEVEGDDVAGAPAAGAAGAADPKAPWASGAGGVYPPAAFNTDTREASLKIDKAKMAGASAWAFVQLFLTASMIYNILAWTNAKLAFDAAGPVSLGVTEAAYYEYFAIHIMMGLIKKHSVDAYWSGKGGVCGGARAAVSAARVRVLTVRCGSPVQRCGPPASPTAACRRSGGSRSASRSVTRTTTTRRTRPCDRRAVPDTTMQYQRRFFGVDHADMVCFAQWQHGAMCMLTARVLVACRYAPCGGGSAGGVA
jgi:hypothetical protein